LRVDMKKTTQFEDVFQEWLEDLYDAEKQIAAAMPKLIAAASSEELSEALTEHLEETKNHATRLDNVFEKISVEPGGRECKPIQALLAEAGRLISEFEKSPALDGALIAAARKIEHYEISGYTSASEVASMLGQQDAYDLLFDTLEEEVEAEEALGDIADALLSGDAVDEVDEEESDEEEDDELEEDEEEEEEELEEKE
jgi:ferritin-like metal-binding protein YciE